MMFEKELCKRSLVPDLEFLKKTLDIARHSTIFTPKHEDSSIYAQN